MKKLKINIDEYLKNDNFSSSDNERKDIYNNKLLSDIGAMSILESKKLSYEKKISKLRKIIDSQKDYFLKECLEIMLFNIGLKSINKEDGNEYLLSYNIECECFYISTYGIHIGKKITYLSRETIKNIIKNEILISER